MGLVNSTMAMVAEKQKEIAQKQQVMQFKKMKNRRDMELATRMAMTRDRVIWMSSFVAFMGTLATVRSIAHKRFSSPPLASIPVVAVSFLIAYQMDFAYGTKSERVQKEAHKILKEELHHWFHQPMELPVTMRDAYMKVYEDHNDYLISHGFPPEKHWGTFPTPPVQDFRSP